MGGGVELNQREGYRGNSSQSWVENTSIANSKKCVNFISFAPANGNYGFNKNSGY